MTPRTWEKAAIPTRGSGLELASECNRVARAHLVEIILRKRSRVLWALVGRLAYAIALAGRCRNNSTSFRSKAFPTSM